MEQKTLENKRTQTAINHNKIAQTRIKQTQISWKYATKKKKKQKV